ncbi:hypothetical protein ACS0TY_003458 [Phlomoides rotata]
MSIGLGSLRLSVLKIRQTSDPHQQLRAHSHDRRRGPFSFRAFFNPNNGRIGAVAESTSR